MTSTVDATTAGTRAVPAVLDLSGYGPRDRLGRLVHADDPAAQLALALANLEDALTAAGLVPAELVEVTVRTTDVEAVTAVLDTLTERFREVGAGPRTAVVGVDRLPLPGQLVAIDGRAARTTTTTRDARTARAHPRAKDSTMTVETTLDPTRTPRPAAALRGLCGGAVHLPGDEGYDSARMPWNVAVDQRPAAVALPRTVDDVRDVVRAASAAGLRVAPQSTGHGAGPLVEGRLDDVVIVRTSAMAAVSVDPAARIARAEGGALWQDVVDAVAPHGLAALHGSSPDVAVAGYSLGGGLGWYARTLGLATNSVTAVELVTADGALVRADAHQHQDLFWALRGGGGSFGVVTAIEFRLYEIADVYAGMLLWDRERAPEVVRAWAHWSATAPDEVTTSMRVMSFPPIPELPEFLRGRQVVVIDGAVLADDPTAQSMLAPLRALQPEIDTFARVPSASLTRLHMDPEGPTPAVAAGTVLARFPEEAVAAYLAEVGPGSTTTLLSAELRQLGGALGRPHPGAGALPRLEGAYAGFFVAMAPTAQLAAQGQADAERLVAALAPWSSEQTLLNFTEQRTDTSAAYGAEAWARLRALRAAVDPHELFVANHPVPASSPS
ncbi:MAG TPA: FAD-binding oxidoreductase [Ornithinibacter sp.]|nr:FAD-binding oxidoreductase [Ornithinibacter sp.]